MGPYEISSFATPKVAVDFLAPPLGELTPKATEGVHLPAQRQSHSTPRLFARTVIEVP